MIKGACIEKKEVPEESNSSYIGKREESLGTRTWTFVLLGLMMFCIATYLYNGAIDFLDVKENPGRPIEVEGEVAKGEAPCPKIAMKRAKIKFLNIDQNKREKILWYKLILEDPRFEQNATSSALYFYSIRFRFTLLDEKGAVLAVTDVPSADLYVGPGEHIYMNNPSRFPLSTAEKIKTVYVTYIVSAYRR